MAAALLLPWLMACDAFDGEMSCTAKEDGKATECQEFTDFSTAAKVTAQASLQLLCTGLGASLSDERCSLDGALAGCRSDNQGQWTNTTWYYATQDTPTADSVSCGSSDVKLLPDGTEAKPSDACSVQSQVSLAPTFVNESDQTISAYWVDTSCIEIYYWTLPAGASQQQQTYVGHVWHFRAGDRQPSGTVVKEYIGVFDDQVGATPTIAIP